MSSAASQSSTQATTRTTATTAGAARTPEHARRRGARLDATRREEPACASRRPESALPRGRCLRRKPRCAHAFGPAVPHPHFPQPWPPKVPEFPAAAAPAPGSLPRCPAPYRPGRGRGEERRRRRECSGAVSVGTASGARSPTLTAARWLPSRGLARVSASTSSSRYLWMRASLRGVHRTVTSAGLWLRPFCGARLRPASESSPGLLCALPLGGENPARRFPWVAGRRCTLCTSLRVKKSVFHSWGREEGEDRLPVGKIRTLLGWGMLGWIRAVTDPWGKSC